MEGGGEGNQSTLHEYYDVENVKKGVTTKLQCNALGVHFYSLFIKSTTTSRSSVNWQHRRSRRLGGCIKYFRVTFADLVCMILIGGRNLKHWTA